MSTASLISPAFAATAGRARLVRFGEVTASPVLVDTVELAKIEATALRVIVHQVGRVPLVISLRRPVPPIPAITARPASTAPTVVIAASVAKALRASTVAETSTTASRYLVSTGAAA